MERSENINELAAALAKAQTEYEAAIKDSDNPYYRSKYADLANIVNATQPALSKNGLVVMQFPITDFENQRAGVLSMLTHISGQWMSQELVLPATSKSEDKFTKQTVIRFDAQTIGIAITYARRYSYQSIVGIAAEPDDDANGISHSNGSKEAAQRVAQEKIATHTEGQGQYSVTLSPYKEGRLSVRGNGLSIVKANLSDADRENFDILFNAADNTVHIKAAQAFAFQDLCKKAEVAAHIEEPTAAAQDPLILSIAERKGKNGPYLGIVWDGKPINIFDRKLWTPLAECYRDKKPVFIETEADGKYVNFVRLVRVNGADWKAPVENAEPPNGEFFGDYNARA